MTQQSISPISQPIDCPIDRWLEVLGGESINLTADEIADTCWLTLVQQRFAAEDAGTEGAIAFDTAPSSSTASGLDIELSAADNKVTSLPPELENKAARPTAQPAGELFLRSASSQKSDSKYSSKPGSNPDSNPRSSSSSQPIRVPAATALRDPLLLARALRPLMQPRPVGQGSQLNETATVQKIAEERVWCPVTQPLTEQWLELAIVVDESASMRIWRRTIRELHRLCKHYGVFRDVRLWGLVVRADGATGSNEIFLRTHPFLKENIRTLRCPDSLVDPTGRRVILLATDCVDELWQMPQLLEVLRRWSRHNPMALLQMMPEWLWQRTNLRQAIRVELQAKDIGSANCMLDVVSANTAYWRRTRAQRQAEDIKIPVITPTFELVQQWARMLADQGTAVVPGVVFTQRAQAMAATAEKRRSRFEGIPTAAQKAQAFRGGASPLARRLASLLAASPAITLPVIRIVQAQLLPISNQVHVAEVLLGGILQPQDDGSLGIDPDDVQYRFVDEAIRAELLAEAPVTDTTAVLSRYIEENFATSLDDFVLELSNQLQPGQEIDDKRKPVAVIAAEVLQYRGVKYADFIAGVKRQFSPSSNPNRQSVSFPSFELFEFVDVQLVDVQLIEEFS